MTSLLSIGTEFETLFLSPILVNDNSFTGIGKDFETLIKYQRLQIISFKSMVTI